MTTDRHRLDEGFTLIELLVVVVILGILASIAFPAFLSQRAKAWEKTAMSDLRNAVIQVEDSTLDGGTYMSIDPSRLTTSDGVTVGFGSRTATAYCLEVDHSRLGAVPDFHFDSTVSRPVAGAC